MKIKKIKSNPKIAKFYNLDYEDRLKWADLNDGIIRINSEIMDYTVEELSREVNYIKNIDLKEARFLISSPGGGAYPAFAMYDILKELSETVKTEAIVEGWAASAAAMIVLQAFPVRIGRRNARFLIHEIRRWVFFAMERKSDLEDEIKEMRNLEDMIIDILKIRCNKTSRQIKDLMRKKETWLSSQEAKDFGLIDKIL